MEPFSWKQDIRDHIQDYLLIAMAIGVVLGVTVAVLCRAHRRPQMAEGAKLMYCSEHKQHECDSCREARIHRRAKTPASINPDFAGYELCDECRAEYDARCELEPKCICKMGRGAHRSDCHYFYMNAR
jgi:hypothetical protein